MAVKNCPHCNFEIPPEFAVMPICSVCGGDVNAQPKQVWSPVAAEKTYNCPSCQTEIQSVLTTQCPSCGTSLRLAEAAEPMPAPTPAPRPPQPLPSRPEPTLTRRPPQPTPQPEKEGFFTKLLRMLGLKK